MNLPYSRFDIGGKKATNKAAMSFTQVLENLPTLSRIERRELSLRLFEIETTEAEADDIAVCEHSAAVGFAVLDAMEAADSAK